MNNLKLHEITIFSIALLGFFPVLPFHKKPFLLIPFGVFSLILANRCKTWGNFNLKNMLLLSSVFFLYLISLIWGDWNIGSQRVLFRLLPVVLLPFLFSIVPLDVVFKGFILFKNIFIYSCVFYGILILIYLNHLGYFAGKVNLWYSYSYIRDKFWGFADHPIYISIYYVIALLFLLHEKYSIKNLFIFLFLFVILILLGRKLSIIIFLLFTILFYFKNVQHGKLKQLPFLIFILLVGGVFCSIPEVSARMLEVFNTSESSSFGIRLNLWTQVPIFFKQNFLLGYGLGEVNDGVNNNLASLGLNNLAKGNYNMHNQYIQILFTTGVFGLLVYLFSVLNLIIKKVGSHKPEMLYILVFLFIQFLIESILERQNGIFIYSLMFCFYFYLQNKKEIKSTF